MSRYFGCESNGKVCDKGCHHGVGEWTPEDRAAKAARIRDVMPDVQTEIQKAFLMDWERHHGKVRYRMEQIGVSEGKYDKNSKGQIIMGPVFIYETHRNARTQYAD